MAFYTDKKERSHRFVLALRMGLPIFLLSVASFLILFLQPKAGVLSLIFLVFILLVIAVYFIFFLINQSTYENITDSTTHTFTPEYFFKLFNKWNKYQTITIAMIRITNLTGINEKYGVRNGDSILVEVTQKINNFFISKDIKVLPICRYKGGDFILMFKGEKEKYSAMMELFLAKYQENIINDIEVTLNGILLDTKHVKKIEEIITRLYEIQYASDNRASLIDDNDIIPEELEKSVLNALEHQCYSVALQSMVSDNMPIEEVTFKLIGEHGNFIHQSRFIPLLNRIGKMSEYEKHLLEIVVSMAKNSDCSYALTLTAARLRNGLFFQYALELLQCYPEAKGKIIIILDEKEYSPQIKRFREQIAQYRAVGYKFALDNYGGNHVSMMYLKEFDVDYVRFDSLYTRHIKEEKYQNIIHGLNITAHLCGASTWILMVEDDQSDKIASQLKINVKQGNFYEKIRLKEKE
ncbi:MAG: EAL domain-containing protein [Sulfuricurvum sp.]|uniref:EAL domain-containing protein n=1 Tax=Sulfuricurvum sp. TaxID=2025608 RepID=UPI002623020E|nr:EAL domain-containing protein [Sulfuricurvum sp.]MDD2828424.1 EAL domain-containing protein [Sulfuricurvum sp.]MDD4949429.1 EAL domain-containing protein [Sulfuricurvum sp.]